MIYVDADATPKIAKELIIKTANRTKVTAVFVANAYIKLPPSPFLKSVVVAQGFDEADSYIVDTVKAGDLVITADIPLANAVLEKSAKVLTTHGEELNNQNIKQKLNNRDFMETLRGTGVLNPHEMGGQKPYDDKDKKRFADGLNRLVKAPSAPRSSMPTSS